MTFVNFLGAVLWSLIPCNVVTYLLFFRRPFIGEEIFKATVCNIVLILLSASLITWLMS